jgi:outer membrane receptor protein involved in Fe transport
MTYATYQRGYKAGGINLAREASGVAGQANEATFDSEAVDNYELGAKTEWWDDSLRLNVAVFHMEFDDLQNQIFIPPLFLVRNGEGAEINGLEIEGALAATENLSFNFGMTLLDTSFDDGTNLGAGDIGGRDLPWAPESSASLGWDYSTPLGGTGLELFWTGSALFRSSYLANSSSDPETEQGSSQMYNTQLGIRTEKWSGMIWCRNCSDKIVQEVQFNNPLPLTGPLAYVNRPMEYGVTVKYNF